MELLSIQNFIHRSFNLTYNSARNACSAIFNTAKKHPHATALVICSIAGTVILRRPEFLEAVTSVNKGSHFENKTDNSIVVVCTKRTEVSQVLEGFAIIAGAKAPPKIDAVFGGIISEEGFLKNVVLVNLFDWIKTRLLTQIKFSVDHKNFKECTPLSNPQDCCDQIAEFLKI